MLDAAATPHPRHPVTAPHSLQPYRRYSRRRSRRHLLHKLAPLQMHALILEDNSARARRRVALGPRGHPHTLDRQRHAARLDAGDKGR